MKIEIPYDMQPYDFIEILENISKEFGLELKSIEDDKDDTTILYELIKK